MKIVYVVRNGFHPPFNGERVKSAALASALAACGELTLVDLGRADYPGNPYPDGERLTLPFGGSAVIHNMIVHGHAGNLRRLRAAATGSVPRLSRLPAARRRAAQRLLAQLRPDVVVADHPLLAPLALESPAAFRIVHAHNVESRLAASIAETSGRLRHRLKAWRLLRVENRVLPRLTQLWAVSEADAAVFRDLGVASVQVTPNVIPDHAFAAATTAGEPGHAAFFGWLAYPPNVEAVDELLGLAERLPELKKLTLIGRGLPAALQARAVANPKVRYLGFVDDLMAATRDAAAILVPLRHGAGTKLKVIEALALAKPLLTTPVGAEGLALVDGVNARIEAIGPKFDAAAAELLSAPAASVGMAAAGRRHAAARFSIQALTDAVRAALALSSSVKS